MKTGTIIATLLLVGAAGTAGYILYTRRKQQQAIDSRVQGDNSAAVAQTQSQYEGKAYKMDGKTYLVRDGVLRHLANPTVRARELGSNDWNLIVKSGVGANVTTLPALPMGPPLNGLVTTKLLF